MEVENGPRIETKVTKVNFQDPIFHWTMIMGEKVHSTLPETNSLHMKFVGSFWRSGFLFGFRPMFFRG